MNTLVDSPTTSEASREVANLTRKNLYTPVYGVKEFVCLSVVNFEPNYLRTGRTQWAKKNLDPCLKFFFL